MLEVSKKRLSPNQLQWVEVQENKINTTADLKEKMVQYRELAQYWMDSAGTFVPYIKYISEAAKLENSEKNLTFAAHLMLAELLTVEEPGLQTWLAVEARQLFEKAKALNPSNDSTLIGLGSCYFFGAGGSEPPMKGILLVREVAEKNPSNVFAQYMLGVGAMVSGQKAKAIERFTNVVNLQPENLEVRLRLADVCEQNGNPSLAKTHYKAFLETVKKMEAKGRFQPNPEMIREIEAHIETLK
jgi:tetratricopeptide (TPR) repeat protein